MKNLTNHLAKIATYSALTIGSIAPAAINTPAITYAAPIKHAERTVTQAPSIAPQFSIANAEIKVINKTAVMKVTLLNQQKLGKTNIKADLKKDNSVVASQKGTVKTLKNGEITIDLPLQKQFEAGNYTIEATLDNGANQTQTAPMTLTAKQAKEQNEKIKDYLAKSPQKTNLVKLGLEALGIFAGVVGIGAIVYFTWFKKKYGVKKNETK